MHSLYTYYIYKYNILKTFFIIVKKNPNIINKVKNYKQKENMMDKKNYIR